MRTLFPEIEPYNSFHFRVSDIHELYVEECGNPDGQPLLFLHGGPGGGFSPTHRRLYDPQHYRIILFDQRGAGRSRPHAELRENTTWDLVSDIEKLRAHLNVDKWVVFGGSWGVTLALAYAETHPDSVTALILRGVFLCREEEIKWFYYPGGTSQIYPDFWEEFQAQVPKEKQDRMVETYYELLTSPDEKTRLAAARAWSGWEGSTLKLIPDEKLIAFFKGDMQAEAMARIECHYFMNRAFFDEKTNPLAKANIDRIRHIPTWIVHGRYDVVCPTKNAWDLHNAFPEANLNIVPDAGHAFDEPGIMHALIEATEACKKLDSRKVGARA